MAGMIAAPHETNGIPVLLDQYGKPITRRQATSGEARPGGIVLPTGWQFISRTYGGHYSFWLDRFDEAMRHSREDAIDMENDPSLMSMIEERIDGTKSLPWHLEVPDEKDPLQMRVKDGLTRLIKGIPRLDEMIEWWLWAIWYGRMGVQVDWQYIPFLDRQPEEIGKPAPALGQPAPGGMPPVPGSAMPMSRRANVLRYQMQEPPDENSQDKGKLRWGLTVREAWPLSGDKISHCEDGTPYALMNWALADQMPKARIINTTVGGAGLLLSGSYRERFLIHRHLVRDRDFFNGFDQQEAIHGVGLRSMLFWGNWLRLEALSKVFDFFSRVGMGLTVWKYPRGNEQARLDAEKAAREQSDRCNIILPVDPDGNKGSGTDIERHEVPTSGAESVMKLVEYFDHWNERLIIGQEGSASATSSSGFSNKGSSEFQQATKASKIKGDAKRLAVTMTGTSQAPGLVNTIQRYTYPRTLERFQTRFVFDLEQKESTEKLSAIRTLVELQVPVKADDARAAAGVSKPASGDEQVTGPQQPGVPGAMPGMPGAPPPGQPAPGAEQQPAAGQPAAGRKQEQEQGDFLGSLNGGTGQPAAGEDQQGDFLQSLLHRRPGSALKYARGSKLERTDLGYAQPPKGSDVPNFAQCASCVNFSGSSCRLFSGKDAVRAGGACDYYSLGKPDTAIKGKESGAMTPASAGYVVRQVRCENCKHYEYDASVCSLYGSLNREQPRRFALNVHVQPQACCNAQEAASEPRGPLGKMPKRQSWKKMATGPRGPVERIAAGKKQTAPDAGFKKLVMVVAHLKQSGKNALAREVVLAYARRREHAGAAGKRGM